MPLSDFTRTDDAASVAAVNVERLLPFTIVFVACKPHLYDSCRAQLTQLFQKYPEARHLSLHRVPHVLDTHFILRGRMRPGDWLSRRCEEWRGHVGDKGLDFVYLDLIPLRLHRLPIDEWSLDACRADSSAQKVGDGDLFYLLLKPVKGRPLDQDVVDSLSEELTALNLLRDVFRVKQAPEPRTRADATREHVQRPISQWSRFDVPYDKGANGLFSNDGRDLKATDTLALLEVSPDSGHRLQTIYDWRDTFADRNKSVMVEIMPAVSAHEAGEYASDEVIRPQEALFRGRKVKQDLR